MTQRWMMVSAALLLYLAGCSQFRQATPAWPGGVPTILPVSGQAVLVELPALTDNPAAFENSLVQLSGTYERLPVIVCSSTPHLPPATWALTSGPHMIHATGFDALLQPLSPTDLSLTVEGGWQRWQGPVGCGKHAIEREIWYLEVSRILSPNPVAQATATPLGSDFVAGRVLTSTPARPAPTADIAEEEDLATLPPLPTPPEDDEDDSQPIPLPEIPTATPGLVVTPTDPAAEGAATGTAMGVAATETAMAALTATPGATMTATATLEAGVTTTATVPPVNQGAVEVEELVKEEVGANEVHRWQFSVESGDVITISVISETALDLALTVRDPSGNTLVAAQNTAPAGRAETVAGLEITTSGDHEILLSSAGGTAGHYALIFMDQITIHPIIFPGTLRYGETTNGVLPVESSHYWHFVGTAGDSISITVTPNDNSDLYFYLIGPAPDMNVVVNIVDSTGSGQAERLVNYALPETGFYTIVVEEVDERQSNYQIQLIRN